MEELTRICSLLRVVQIEHSELLPAALVLLAHPLATTREMAAELGVSDRTVARHLRRLARYEHFAELLTARRIYLSRRGSSRPPTPSHEVGCSRSMDL